MTPPAAEELIPRHFLGPALRTQSDRRLVHLVRDGYETAFDEIVRRYGRQLRRYAGAIVGGRAEDVTQDAFSKALLALRRDKGEIDLRPWLYRIVRNTALNDLRDRPPAVVALAETIEGRASVVEELEQREEVAELVDRLRALPEPQRAAIVMRELEGLGHEEIAAALGVSDGAARQAIHRARTALRNGVGMAVPLPVLRAMLEGSVTGTAEVAAGGAGAGILLKGATATVLVVGTFSAGVALHESDRGGGAGRGAHADGSVSRSKPPGRPATLASAGLARHLARSGRSGGASRHADGRPGRSSHEDNDASTGRGDGHGTSGHHGSSSGPSGDNRDGGHSSPQPSGHGGGDSPDDLAPDADRSGPDGGSISTGGSSGQSSSGSSGPSGSRETTESNSGPGSGDDGLTEAEASTSGSGGS
jgi:RNA polymerase sigma factor (sigma-70 family)